MNTLQLTHVPTVRVGMLIRRPPATVFRAFVDPSVTTRFWYTRSSGPMTPGATLRWDWEMYDVSATVAVKEVDDDRRIVFEWGDDRPTTVELVFTPRADGTTYVESPRAGSVEAGTRSCPMPRARPAASPRSCAR